MTDRDALCSMLIYAQREAEDMKLPSVAELLRQAVAKMDMTRSPAPSDAGGMIRSDMSGDMDVNLHFTCGRLQ